MKFRLRGDKGGRPDSAEINKWNKLADQQARGELRRLPPLNLRTYDPNARIVRAKNVSGADRLAYDCMSIDGLLWDLEADGSADVLFRLTAANPNNAPAILLEPIGNNELGLAVIDGPAIAKIDQATSTAFRWADPQASTHSLEAAASGSIKLLQAPSTTGSKIMPVILNAAEQTTKIVQAGSGIAARSGTLLGSATCTEFKVESGSIITNTATLTVRNLSLFSIPSNAYVMAHKEAISGEWIAQAVINGLRFLSPNLQYTIDGTTWVTWHEAGVDCPPPP